ncbi:hypothetical protein VULLAG_LOCUS7732 [Vulpes lagopus]
MVTAGATQPRPFLRTWPRLPEPGSARLAPTAPTVRDPGSPAARPAPRRPALRLAPADRRACEDRALRLRAATGARAPAGGESRLGEEGQGRMWRRPRRVRAPVSRKTPETEE